METLFLIYHESFEPDVTAIIERHMVVSRYTRIDDVIGARMVEREEDTGHRSERQNRIILIVAEPSVITGMLDELKALRDREGHGIRAFVVPVSRVI